MHLPLHNIAVRAKMTRTIAIVTGTAKAYTMIESDLSAAVLWEGSRRAAAVDSIDVVVAIANLASPESVMLGFDPIDAVVAVDNFASPESVMLGVDSMDAVVGVDVSFPHFRLCVSVHS